MYGSLLEWSAFSDHEEDTRGCIPQTSEYSSLIGVRMTAARSGSGRVKTLWEENQKAREKVNKCWVTMVCMSLFYIFNLIKQTTYSLLHLSTVALSVKIQNA